MWDVTRGVEFNLIDMNAAEVDLSGKNIGVSGATAIAAVLPGSSVTTLNLFSNKIGDEGCKAIADKLPGSSVTTLYLRDNYDIGDEAKSALKAAAEAKGCTLHI